MPIEITTGTVLAPNSLGADCAPVGEPCVFFDVSSTSDVSHVFEIGDEPLEIIAFDLGPQDCVYLEQVWGDAGGTHFESVVRNGKTFSITACSNRLLVPFSGRFRLRLSGDVGLSTVVCNPISCCMAEIHGKGSDMSCGTNEPLTNTEIAAMLAFRKTDGGHVTPGECLATCADITALDSRVDAIEGATGPAPFVNCAGAPVAAGTAIATCADLNSLVNGATSPSALATALSFDDCNGTPIGAGAALATCANLTSAMSTISAGAGALLDLAGTTLSLRSSAGGLLDTVDLSSLAGGGGAVADGNISNVTLVGTNLTFTGANGGFNGSVDLSSLSGGGGGTADGVITNVALAGTNLNFTGSGGGFNGSVDLSAFAGGPDGNISNVALVGTNLNFTGSGGGFNGSVDLSSIAGSSGGSLTNNANGYHVTRADGLIEQWGTVFVTQGEGAVPITFPIPFNNLASVNIQVSIIGSGAGGNDMWVQLLAGWTVNDFVAFYQSSGTGQSGFGISWRAIGG